MDCPTCKKVVFSGDQFCRHCGARLPASGAAGEDVMRSLRGAMDGAVAAVDRAWKQAEPHVQRAATETKKAGASAWRETQPYIDNAVKAFDDAMRSVAASKPVTKARETTAPAARAASKSARAASKSARGAASKASAATRPVVADMAEAVEKGARRVKEKARTKK